MTKEKRILYRKAYVEIYEMVKLLSDEEREKIPEYFIEYIYNNMDTNYIFHVDTTRGLLEQNYMIETKALIVKLYEKYFAPESENEFWNKYHRICFNMIDEEKKRKYNSNDIFKNQEQTKKLENIEKPVDKIVKNEVSMVKYKKTIFQRVLNKIRSIFHKI